MQSETGDTMTVRVQEVVERYVFRELGQGTVFKGRITYNNQSPNLSGLYEWQISHHYKGGADAVGPYCLSITTGN